MKIKSVFLKNVKSFDSEVEINFRTESNILIGPNGGGKSNLIEILQGVFNNFIFRNITLSNEDQAEQRKARKLFKTAPQNGDISQILDAFYGKDSEEQKVHIILGIENSDIENIERFKTIKDSLLDFERRIFSNETIRDFANEINFDSDFKSLVGTDLSLNIINRHLAEPGESDEDPIRQFFKFLKYSEAFSNFANFYSLTERVVTEFRPYLLYISPYRQPVQIPNVEEQIDLSASDNYENFFKQINLTQHQPQDAWTFTKRLLVENEHNGKQDENMFFKDLMNEIVGIDYKVEKINHPYKNLYSLSIFRIDGSSPQLSSGEKEFAYLISNIFARYIQNGIILIDEPELHLHPRWQRKFVGLLQELSTKRNLQSILVTHSPHLVTLKTLKSLMRVAKENGSSKVVPTNRPTRVNQIFKIVTASNNEKVFFADKVVLVEGDIDRIIFESILKRKQKELNNFQSVEVIEVLGKYNFSKFKSFLDSWEIPSYQIADLDHLKNIGDSTIKSYFQTSTESLKDGLCDRNSKDAGALIGSLVGVAKVKSSSQVSKKNFSNLQSLVKHLIKRHKRFPSKFSREQGRYLANFVDSKYKDGVFVLKKGQIEDYFGVRKFNSPEQAIRVAQDIENGKLKIPRELTTIFNSIISP